MKTLGIIPARYASSRLPGKVLEKIGDKTMIQWVYERACKAGLDEVLIATDDDRVAEKAGDFGAKVVKTGTELVSGTERCAEALSKLTSDFDLVVNIQGDEPFIDPKQIQNLVTTLKNPENPSNIATLVQPISDSQILLSPNVVKAVEDQQGNALYFSRNAIPYQRNEAPEQWVKKHFYLQHIGIYAYKSKVLPELVKLPESTLEKAESLEQLRWMDHGYSIRLVHTQGKGIGVDTPEDLEAARTYFKQYGDQTI